MTDLTLSDELRRFIQTIESIPHLEAMLLLRQDKTQIWNEHSIAKRLYLNPDKAANMLADLYAQGICIPTPECQGFIYAQSSDLIEIIDQLAIYYANNLIEITNMIHAKAKNEHRARRFADAFRFKKRDQ